jgi:hypothetical protein
VQYKCGCIQKFLQRVTTKYELIFVTGLFLFAVHLLFYAKGPVFQFLPLQAQTAIVCNFKAIQNKKKSQDAKSDTQEHVTTGMFQVATIANAFAPSSPTEAPPLQRPMCSLLPLEFTGRLNLLAIS